MKSSARICFFIRANNDVDHFSPYIYKLRQFEDVEHISIFNWSFKENYFKDRRILYLLEDSKVSYTNLFEKYPSKLASLYTIVSQWFSKIPRIPKLTGLINRGLMLIESKIRYDGFPLEEVLDGYNIVLVDHSIAEFVVDILRTSKRKGIPTGMLMHGLDPTQNIIMSSEFLFPQRETLFAKIGNLSSKVYVNNVLYKTKCEVEGIQSSRMQVIGSPRFMYEWSDHLDRISDSEILTNFGKGKIKIAVMLSKWHYNVWEEETNRIIRTLIEIEDVFVFVKPHTRGMMFDKVNQINLFVDNKNDYSSRAIIRWSNLVLFSISSIFLDALLLDKPVLHLRLTTSNKLACSDFMEKINVDSRDQLIEEIEKLKQDTKYRTYSIEERNRCLEYYSLNQSKSLSDICKEILDLKNGDE